MSNTFNWDNPCHTGKLQKLRKKHKMAKNHNFSFDNSTYIETYNLAILVDKALILPTVCSDEKLFSSVSELFYYGPLNEVTSKNCIVFDGQPLHMHQSYTVQVPLVYDFKYK